VDAFKPRLPGNSKRPPPGRGLRDFGLIYCLAASPGSPLGPAGPNAPAGPAGPGGPAGHHYSSRWPSKARLTRVINIERPHDPTPNRVSQFQDLGINPN
jgi:hypothetical protein